MKDKGLPHQTAVAGEQKFWVNGWGASGWVLGLRAGEWECRVFCHPASDSFQGHTPNPPSGLSQAL